MTTFFLNIILSSIGFIFFLSLILYGYRDEIKSQLKNKKIDKIDKERQ